MSFLQFQGVGAGIIRGCGKQDLGSFAAGVGYTVALIIGIPLVLLVSKDIMSKLLITPFTLGA